MALKTGFKVAAFQGPMLCKQPGKVTEKILELLTIADRQNVDILCLPEAYLQGYFTSPEEAWDNSIDLKTRAFADFCAQFSPFKTTLLLGLNEQEDNELYDTVVVIENGAFIGKYRKAYPYYDYFRPGRDFPVFEKKGIRYGIIICLDSRYLEPAKILALKGAQIIFCPMCNKTDLDYHTFNHPKLLRQKSHFIARSFENHAWFAASDIIWPGDGNMIAPGYACIYNSEGEEIQSAAPFREQLLIQEIPFESLNIRKLRRVHGNSELANILAREREKAVY